MGYKTLFEQIKTSVLGILRLRKELIILVGVVIGRYGCKQLHSREDNSQSLKHYRLRVISLVIHLYL